MACYIIEPTRELIGNRCKSNGNRLLILGRTSCTQTDPNGNSSFCCKSTGAIFQSAHSSLANTLDARQLYMSYSLAIECGDGMGTFQKSAVRCSSSVDVLLLMFIARLKSRCCCAACPMFLANDTAACGRASCHDAVSWIELVPNISRTSERTS